MPNKKAQNNTLNLRKTTLYSFFKQGLLVLFTSLTMMLVGCGDDPAQTKSTEKEITSFKFEATKNTALSADADGTISGTAISVTLPAGTDVSTLAPTIGSKGVKINPGNGVVQDFTSPVTYTMTAEDGTTVAYTVTVTAPTTNTPSSKDITMFDFKATPNNALNADIDGTISGTAIALTVPAGTDVSALIPEIAHSGMSIAPQNRAVQNFSQPVNYTVTAQDNSTKQYVVTVIVQSTSSKDITMFDFKATPNNALDTDVVGTISGTAITLTVPAGTDVSALISEIAHSGKSIAPQNRAVQNFSQPVNYTVTAQDNSTKQYVVTVIVRSTSSKDITIFDFKATPNNALDTDVVGTISGTAITLTVPAGTDVSALIPEIAHSGMSIAPQNRAVQNFSQPVTYTVTAQDNNTKQYVVTVIVRSTSSKDITMFGFKATPNNALSADVDGTISGTAIALAVPAGTNVTALIPEIAHSGMSIAPQSGVVQDFSQNVNYTVTAEDGTTAAYTVTVTVTAPKIAIDTYTSSTNLGPAIIDDLLDNAYAIATVSGIPQNAAAQILIKTGSGSNANTRTLDVTAANNEAAIPKSELNALITASTNSLSLRISVTQSDSMSNEVTLTYTHNALYTWQDVQAMRQRLTEDYTLMNDIAFPDKGQDGFPAEGFEPIGQYIDADNDGVNDDDASLFQGSFDGGGHTISNFSSIRPTLDYVGLFGYAQSPAMATSPKIIQDVVIIQSGIEGSPASRVGTLAGYLSNVTVNGVGAESTTDTDLLKGDQVGGLVGYASGCRINGYAKVNIGQKSPTSKFTVLGGLIGSLLNATNAVSVVNGYATGNINAPAAATDGTYLVAIGGLVGRISVNNTNTNPLTVTGYATGNISAHSGAGNSVFGIGGLIGSTTNGRYTIQGYARGTVTKTDGANNRVGLFVGHVATAANGSISGYRSGKTGESTRTGVTTPSSTVNDGTAITVTAATAASDFSNLTFGSAVGEWAITTGEWPAINLSTTATGAFSTNDQPTAR